MQNSFNVLYHHRETRKGEGSVVGIWECVSQYDVYHHRKTWKGEGRWWTFGKSIFFFFF